MVKFIILAVLSGLFMVLDYRKEKLLPVRTALQMALYPIQAVVDAPSRAIMTLTDFFSDHETLSNKNHELSTYINIYAAKDQKYISIQRENERLRAQLNATTAVSERFMLAEILSVSSNPFSKTVTINKGTNSGIFVGQVVLAAENIYGQVKSVSPTSAVIIQLTDIKHAIPVRNVRTGLSALASGTGKLNQLELKHVEASVDIQVGDVFVSSGLGQLFPPDFPVAKVRKVGYNPGDSFMNVYANSLADFNKTREILLIWRADYARNALLSTKQETTQKKVQKKVQKKTKNKKAKKSKN